MTTEVDLCNRALLYIGAADITARDEDSTEAIACDVVFDRALREMQGMYDWNYNLTVAESIAAQTEMSLLPGFRYKHRIPEDFLRRGEVCRVYDENESDDRIYWDKDFHTRISPPLDGVDDTPGFTRYRQAPIKSRIAGGFVHTNFTPIRLIYHKYDPSVAHLDPLFEDAFVLYLASKIVYPLFKDVNFTRSVKDEATRSMKIAQDNEDKQNIDMTPLGSSFVDARYY